MSREDDQRAAERGLDALRRRHEPDQDAHAIGWALRELARLRAELADAREERVKYGEGWVAAQRELAETRAAGDGLARIVARCWHDVHEHLPEALAGDANRAQEAWRSVRGDARTDEHVSDRADDGDARPPRIWWDGRDLHVLRATPALPTLYWVPDERHLPDHGGLTELAPADDTAAVRGDARTEPPADEDAETILSERVTDPDLAAACRDFEGRAPSDDVPWWVAMRMYQVVAEHTDRAAPADDDWRPGDPVHGGRLDAELGTEGVSWSAHLLDADRAAQLHDDEPAPAGWYVIGLEDPDEPESVLVSLFVDHAVRADGAVAGEAVARRLAALLSAGPVTTPADDTAQTSVRKELLLDEDAPESAVVGRLRLLKSRYERLSAAAGHVVPADDTAAPDGERIGRALTVLRTALGLHYDEVAARVGISTQRLGAMETGAELTIKPDQIRPILAVLAAPVDDTTAPDGAPTDAPNGMRRARNALMAEIGDPGPIVAHERNERGYLWWTATRVYGAKPEKREIRSLPRNPSAAPADDTAAPDGPRAALDEAEKRLTETAAMLDDHRSDVLHGLSRELQMAAPTSAMDQVAHALLGLNPYGIPDGPANDTAAPNLTRDSDEWCVFYGGPEPDEAAGLEIAGREEAEESSQWLIESGVAVRRVYRSPWQIREQCSSCRSVLDGRDDCCDARQAKAAAGPSPAGTDDDALPVIDPTIAQGIRLEDIRYRTPRDLGIGSSDEDGQR